MGIDNALLRQPNGRYDFEIVNGNPVTTDDQSPAILRLIRQGEWIGDNGERSGKSLDEIHFASEVELSLARAILETRLGVLVRARRLEAVNVKRVAPLQTSSGEELSFEVEVKHFGKPAVSSQARVVK
jgi:hypothetical protein